MKRTYESNLANLKNCHTRIVKLLQSKVSCELENAGLTKLSIAINEHFNNYFKLISNHKDEDYESFSLSMFRLCEFPVEAFKKLSIPITFEIKEYWNAIIHEILKKEGITVKREVDKFNPSKVPYLFIYSNNCFDCISHIINFLKKLSSKKKKMNFLIKLRKNILSQSIPIFGDDAPVGSICYHKWNIESQSLTRIEIDYETIVAWIDGHLEVYSVELELQLGDNLKELLFKLLTKPLENSKDVAIINAKVTGSTCLNHLLNSRTLNSSINAINKPELLIAIISWINLNSKMKLLKSDIIIWLKKSGIDMLEGYQERSLFNKVNNERWTSTILENWGLNLSSSLAVKKSKF